MPGSPSEVASTIKALESPTVKTPSSKIYKNSPSLGSGDGKKRAPSKRMKREAPSSSESY